MKKLHWQTLVAVCWLLLIGGLIRVWGWEAYAFSPDDVMHLNIAAQPTLARLWASSQDLIHPPLLYLIYHVALKVSRDMDWLRSIPLAAGLATMVVLFFVGRRAAGNLAGTVMVGLTAFSYGNILMSQVVRHYGLLELFLSLALYFFIAWQQAPKKIHQWGFALACLAASCTHYSGLIALAGIGVAGLIWLAPRRRPRREYLALVLAFLPSVAALSYFLWAHVANIFISGTYGKLREGYLNKYFPTSPGQFGDNLWELFGYLFLPPVAPGMMVAVLVGLYVLWRRGEKAPALSIVTTFALAVGLNLADKYPLGGSRHSIHLFPALALAVGAGAQGVWEWLEAWPTHFRSLRRKWVGSQGSEVQSPETCKPTHPRTDGWGTHLVMYLALAALIVSSVVSLKWFRQSDFLRRYHGQSWMEFPVVRGEYMATFGVLRREVRPGDVLITTAQTSKYLRWESGGEPEAVAEGLMRVRYLGRDFYFAPRSWVYDSVGALTDVVRKLEPRTDLARARRVWLLNLGWGRGFPKEVDKTTRVEIGGAHLYFLTPPQLRALLPPAD